jgi:hypothetical protein
MRAMSFFANIYTDVMELAEVKKLLSNIKKQPSPGGWNDTFGPGGSEKEMKLSDLTGDMLKDVDLTSYCSSLMLCTSSFQMYSRESFPKSLHLGGDEWWPGGCGGDAGVQVAIKIRELNFPIWLSYWKDTEIGYAGRGYDECVKLSVRGGAESIRYCLSDLPEFVIGESPESHVVDEYLNSLITRFGFPTSESPGVLQPSSKGIVNSGFEYNLVPGALGWDGARFSAMIHELVDESPMDKFALLSTVNLGIRANFHGKIQNLTEDARDLLECVSQNNDFPSYKLTYYPIGVESWVKREKARKKLRKQKLHRDLGVAILANGGLINVGLVLSKEGYVFHLNFDCDEDLSLFMESKLYQKTQWHFVS